MLMGMAAWNFSRTTTGPSPSIWMGTQSSVSGGAAGCGSGGSSRASRGPGTRARWFPAVPGAEPGSAGWPTPAGTGRRAVAPSAAGAACPFLPRAPAPRPPQARFQLGKRASERRIPIVRRRFRADDRAARSDRQLNALAPVGLTWITLGANLHIDRDRLAVQLFDPGQLG